MKKIIYSEAQLAQIAQELWALRDRCKIYTFTGSLGVGKTTLVRQMLQLAGVQGLISSPTFTYMNVYKNEQGQTFYHFDLYRLDSVQQFQMMGFDEYLHAPNSWAFIEWPEPLLPILNHQVCNIALDYCPDGQRQLVYEVKA
jgi:tRNA threonylcarbamoyladenosine biosynthesis protein TsaE